MQPDEGITIICSEHGQQRLRYLTFGGFVLDCGCEWTHQDGRLRRLDRAELSTPLDIRRKRPLIARRERKW